MEKLFENWGLEPPVARATVLTHVELWPTAIKLNPLWKTEVIKSPWMSPHLSLFCPFKLSVLNWTKWNNNGPFWKKSNFIEFYSHNKWNQWFKSNIFGKNLQLFQFYLELPIFYYFQRKSVSTYPQEKINQCLTSINRCLTDVFKI